jgi:hypothetical protein
MDIQAWMGGVGQMKQISYDLTLVLKQNEDGQVQAIYVAQTWQGKQVWKRSKWHNDTIDALIDLNGQAGPFFQTKLEGEKS